MEGNDETDRRGCSEKKIEQSGGEGTIARYCKKVLAECLDNDAPTIPVIPVEWLEKKLHEGYHRMCVKAVLDMWQKEQEAR